MIRCHREMMIRFEDMCHAVPYVHCVVQRRSFHHRVLTSMNSVGGVINTFLKNEIKLSKITDKLCSM